MDPAIRIEPGAAHVVVGSRTVPVHTLWLGGIPRGAVLLLLDADTTSYDGTEAMNELAAHGYESLAADPTGPDDATQRAIVDALVGQLAERGWTTEQIGVVGLGSGGRAALLAAADTTFGGAVSVAPTGIPDLLAEPGRIGAGVRTPWLGLFGAADDATSGDVLAALIDALGPESPVYTELVRYRGVADGFFRDSHQPLVHAAAFDAWQRIIEWLDARVVPRPTPLARAWRMRQLVDQ